MSEKDIKSSIRKYLKTIPCSKFFPYNPMYGEAGIPDIVGAIQGRFIAFEVKMPGKKATTLQLHQINAIKEAGGLAYIVYSLQDVKDIILNLITIRSKEHDTTKQIISH